MTIFGSSSVWLATALFTVIGSLVPLGLVLWGAHRANSDAEVADWASAHALRLTPRNRPMVGYYLLLGRLLRGIGGVAGLVLGSLAEGAFGVGVASGFLFWAWAMGGYLFGALWAEVFVIRPAGPTPVAAIAPRRLRNYLPGRLRWSLRVAGGVSLLFGVIAWRVEVSPGALGGLVALTATGSLAVGVVGAVVALTVECLQRFVVGRSQRFVSRDLLEADDAMRAASVHTLAGAGLGMVILTIAAALGRLLEVHRHVPYGLRVTPVVLILVALFAWRYYSHRAWRVNRLPIAPPVVS